MVFFVILLVAVGLRVRTISCNVVLLFSDFPLVLEDKMEIAFIALLVLFSMYDCRMETFEVVAEFFEFLCEIRDFLFLLCRNLIRHLGLTECEKLDTHLDI